MPINASEKSPSFFVRLAGIAGIAAFCLAAAASFILGGLKPGYDPIKSTISELGESGGANYLAAGAVFILIGLAEAVFAVGLWLRSRRYKLALVGSVLLIVNGVFDYVGSGLFPCDAGGKYESTFGQIHFVVSLIGMTAMVLPAFFYWRVFRAEKRAPENTFTLVAAFVIALGGLLFIISFFTETYVGLAQRFLDFAYFVWILVIGVGMLKADRAAA